MRVLFLIWTNRVYIGFQKDINSNINLVKKLKFWSKTNNETYRPNL